MSMPLRTLPARNGTVGCLPKRDESLEKCRFCAHSVRFVVGGKEVASPARAFCTLSRSTTEVDLKKVEAVICDDSRGEGFRSIMNVIS